MTNKIIFKNLSFSKVLCTEWKSREAFILQNLLAIGPAFVTLFWNSLTIREKTFWPFKQETENFLSNFWPLLYPDTPIWLLKEGKWKSGRSLPQFLSSFWINFDPFCPWECTRLNDSFRYSKLPPSLININYLSCYYGYIRI